MQREESDETSAKYSRQGSAGQAGSVPVPISGQVPATKPERRVIMSESSQIESEATDEGGVKSATSRSKQELEKQEETVRQLGRSGIEKTTTDSKKINERAEEQSERSFDGGKETSTSSSVNKSDTKKSTSVTDYGNGGGVTTRSQVTKRSEISEQSETVSSSNSATSRRLATDRDSPRRLKIDQRSASLQAEDLDMFGTRDRRRDRPTGVRRPDLGDTGGTRATGGILRELERLLADEDRYLEEARTAKREQLSSFDKRSDEIRKEVNDLVATFFDRKRDRRRRGDDFFEDATRRAEEIVRDFVREDDDPWREEEERWRRQRQIRRQDSEDFFEKAIKKAESLLQEMQTRRESRSRAETGIFSKYDDEISDFFGRKPRSGRSDFDEGLAGRRRAGERFTTGSALADELVRDFFSDGRSTRATDEGWSRQRERSESTHVEIDEPSSIASTIGRGRPRNVHSNVDIEELSSSTAADRSRFTDAADRSRFTERSKAHGDTRLVDDIVREFMADDLDDDTWTGRPAGRPRHPERQDSGTSTVDEQCSIRSESRMSELADEHRQERSRSEEHAEHMTSGLRADVTTGSKREEVKREEHVAESESMQQRLSEERSQRSAASQRSQVEQEAMKVEARTSEERSHQSEVPSVSEEAKAEVHQTLKTERVGTQQAEQASRAEHAEEQTQEKSEQQHEEGAEVEKQEEGEEVKDKSYGALKRAEELLFGFVPDWEREEERWSHVRTERIAESTGDRKVQELLKDYKPLRFVKEDDIRAKQQHERKTEAYENLISGDVWKGFKDNGASSRLGGVGRSKQADEILSDIRSAKLGTNRSDIRSSFGSRRAESLKEPTLSSKVTSSSSSTTSKSTSKETSGTSSSGAKSKLDEFRSFKEDLWHEKE